MATNATSTAGTAQFNRTLGEFKRELPPDEVDDFNFITSTDLKKAILQLQDDQKSEKRMQNLRRLSAFLEAMDQFDKVVQVFLNASDYLGFIWGPARFMLLAASTYSESLNTLLDAYQEIGEHMPLLEQYESHISSNPYLQEIVGLIYNDILSFHRRAMKHFRQRAWKKLFHATWRTFRTDFGAIISNLQSHRRLLDSQAIFVGVQEIMKAMRELHETRKVLDDECKRRQDEDVNRQQLAVVSWLSPADSASDHEDALAVHENNSGSGLWLFEQDVIKDWIYPGSSLEPLLWIHGKPGAGKTILASNLIEQCRHQPNSTVAYFYCKHGDPSRDNFISLAQSMIFQFTRLNPLLLPFVLQSQAASGTNSLRSSKIAKEILATAVESFDDLILIIDGLDECIKSQKNEIVCWVRSALVSAETNGSRNLRCCFLSQDDNDTGKLLKGLPTFRITEKHNGEDISRYCQRRANEIGQDFGLSPDDVQNLTKCVSTKADGMFLYAKLVMDNLAGQVSKAALYEEMEKLPPDINQIYQRIKHRILEESSPPERKVAKKLLSWLLCAKRPLKWHEIQGAMCLNPENDSFDSERRLFKDVKDFCGSLVEVRKGGLICFVHLTAKCFLQNEPVLPKYLEHVNLTRLCFTQLSLASHASNISQECIRGYIVRGEYAFTDYSIIYAFDHLLDVLSAKDETVDPGYGPLRKNLRKFVTHRVNVPEKRALANKHVDNKLQVFKDENFYNGLKHAITYHKDSIEKQAKDAAEGEPVLALVQQCMRVRSVLEKMLVPESTPSLDSLYGHNLFKCSEIRCESFHNGFPSQKIRDRHLAQHERIYLCSVPGCSSAMIGFSSSINLQKHQQDYHNGASVEIDFPWHGKLEGLDIVAEIRKGNQSALELWLSQWEDTVPREKLWNWRTSPLAAAVSHSQNGMVEALLDKIRPDIGQKYVLEAITQAIHLGNEDGFWMMLKHCRGIVDRNLYGFLTTALKKGKDEIAKGLLKHHSSPLHNQRKRARNTSYMNLAIRHGRYTVFQHILEAYKIDASQEDDKGRTPLIAAAEFDRTEIAKYLIDTASCDKWARNKKGDTPLSMASRQGHSEFISSIYHENISDELVQEWLRTAQLRNAARNGDDKKVGELLNDGLLHVDEVDTQGRSPWLWAVKSGHERVVEAFFSRTDIVFERHFPEGYRRGNKNGPSAIHFLARSGNDSLIQLLLQSGKLDNEIDRECSYFGNKLHGTGVSGTPIDIARECKHEDTARIIEDYKATLDKKDEEGTV